MMDLESFRTRYATEIVGQAPELVDALDTVRRVADTDCTVLVTGESGTGKELFARAIHRASDRRDGPFVALNCAAIPDTLIESELFGHVRGAFSGATGARTGRFAAAGGGTLFLDEIGEMPAAAQAKLLRVLQESRITPVGSDDEIEIDVRIVAATNQDLDDLMQAGAFRADLFYRLAVIPVHLPALRERKEDIPALAEALLERANQRHERRVEGFSAEALRALGDHDWRGNIRELGHVIERAVLIKRDGTLSPGDLGLRSSRSRFAQGSSPAIPAITEEDLDLRNAMSQVERTLINTALDRTGGNRTEAAALLGLNRTTLVEKLKKYA